VPVTTISTRAALRSAARGDLVVPRTLHIGNLAFCFKPATSWSRIWHSDHYTTKPPVRGRIINAIVTQLQYDCDWAVDVDDLWRLSVLPTYYVPKDGALSSYKEYISMLPTMDHPEAFGQHPNADITSQIQETRMLFEVLLSLQPQTAVGVGESREEKVSCTVWQMIELWSEITGWRWWRW